MRKIVIATSCLLLGACSAAQWNQSLSTPEDRAFALQVIAALRAGNVTKLRGMLEPELFMQTLPQLPVAKTIMAVPGTPELVTVNRNSVAGGGVTHTTTCLNYQYGEGRKWLFLQICLANQGTTVRVNGWRAIPSDTRPTSAGDFSFADKGIQHYLWLVAMIAAVATTLTACVLAILSKGIKRRWLWAIGSLLGFMQFSLNWSTGAWLVSPIYVSLLGAAALRSSPFDPWVMSFSIPVIGIVFLVRRKALLAHVAKASPAPE